MLQTLRDSLFLEITKDIKINFLNRKNQNEDIDKIKNYINSTIKDSLNDALFERKEMIFYTREAEKFIQEKFQVRYISTVNISFNADNNVDIGNSVSSNLLDLAIDKEMETLIKLTNKKYQELFANQINSMLKDTQKEFIFHKNKYTIFDSKANKALALNHLSSGERQLIYIMATAANLGNAPSVFLMDEPEISLHLGWQEKILDALRNINDQMQIIIVTHSPAIVMNGYMDSYIDMADIVTEY